MNIYNLIDDSEKKSAVFIEMENDEINILAKELLAITYDIDNQHAIISFKSPNNSESVIGVIINKDFFRILSNRITELDMEYTHVDYGEYELN